MDRRQFVAGSASSLVALLAGCFGNDDGSEFEDEYTGLDEFPAEPTPTPREINTEFSVSGGWIQGRHDPRLTATNREGISDGAALSLSWETTLPTRGDESGEPEVSPVRATPDGVVYCAAVTRRDDSDRSIALLQVDEGSIEDRIVADIDLSLSGTTLRLIDVALVKETAVCSFRKNSQPIDGGISGELVTFDLSSGQIKYTLDHSGGGLITVGGETIYVGTVLDKAGFNSEDGTAGLAAIDVQTGTVRWQEELAEYSSPADTYPRNSMRPAVYGGSVYVSSPDGIHRLDPATDASTVITERNGPCLIDGNRGLLYVLGENEVAGIDISLGMGSVAGTVNVAGAPRGAALADGTLIVTTDEAISAFDVPAGKTLWRRTEAAIESRPSIGGETVYYALPNALTGLNRVTGEEAVPPVPFNTGSGKAPGPLSPQPILADGSVHVRADDTLYAFRDSDGQ